MIFSPLVYIGLVSVSMVGPPQYNGYGQWSLKQIHNSVKFKPRHLHGRCKWREKSLMYFPGGLLAFQGHLQEITYIKSYFE